VWGGGEEGSFGGGLTGTGRRWRGKEERRGEGGVSRLAGRSSPHLAHSMILAGCTPCVTMRSWFFSELAALPCCVPPPQQTHPGMGVTTFIPDAVASQPRKSGPGSPHALVTSGASSEGGLRLALGNRRLMLEQAVSIGEGSQISILLFPSCLWKGGGRDSCCWSRQCP
jgi:hypothetical protein